MTPDQLERFRALSVKVADAALIHADPENWTGHGIPPCDMDKETRGNAKWDLALAAQSLSVLIRVLQIAGISEGVEDPHEPVDPYTAEKEAIALLDRVTKKRRGL